jgi:hypothetical protein
MTSFGIAFLTLFSEAPDKKARAKREERGPPNNHLRVAALAAEV